MKQPRTLVAPGLVCGRLTVLERAASDGNRRLSRKWHCVCACGKRRTVFGPDLINGHTSSCGCYRREATRAQRTTHGETANGAWSTEYRIWRAMMRRCCSENDPAYKNYGGRGITVCERWLLSFNAFLEDMGRRPAGTSIDRINNNLGYFKENCRWADSKTQAKNTRRNRVATFNGFTKCVSDWCWRLGRKREVVFARIALGWSTEDAIQTPTDGMRHSNPATRKQNERRRAATAAKKKAPASVTQPAPDSGFLR